MGRRQASKTKRYSRKDKQFLRSAISNQRGLKAVVCAKTGKNGYANIVDAKMILATLMKRSSGGRGSNEKRVYKCPFCEMYHLTSQKEYKNFGKTRKNEN